jgi:hypothetical protein
MKNIRKFSRRPYFFAGSFKRDLNGRQIDSRTSKIIAQRYAQHLRKRGNNARVVNWVGGSGVYVGQRSYDKTKREARKDWLDTYSKMSDEKQQRNEFMRMIGQAELIGTAPVMAGGLLREAQGVQKRRTQYYDKNGRPIEVLNNSGRLNELKFKIAQIQGGTLTQDDLTDEERFIFEGLALRRGATSAKHTYQDGIPIDRRIDQVIMNSDFDKFNIEIIGEDDEFYMPPKSQQEVVDSMIADKFNELDQLNIDEIIKRQSVVDNSAIAADTDLYLHLNAIESSWPLVENVLDSGDAEFYESGTNPNLSKKTVSGLTGWGTEITKGPGKGRFANVSEELARYHVAAAYTTEDGYEETPLMTFRTEEQAEEFLQRLDQLGRTRGEFLFGRERVDNEGELPPIEDFDLILPYENVELSVVRETASDAEKEALENEIAFENATLLNVNNPDRETGIVQSSVLNDAATVLDPRSFEAQQDRFFRENGLGRYSGFVEDGAGEMRVRDGGVLFPTTAGNQSAAGPARPFDNLTEEIGVAGAERLLNGVSVVEILDIFKVNENLPNDRQRQMNIDWANNLQSVAEAQGYGYTWGYRDKGIYMRWTPSGFVLVDDDLADMIRNNESLSGSSLYRDWLNKLDSNPRSEDKMDFDKLNELMGDYGVDYRFAMTDESRIAAEALRQNLAQQIEQMLDSNGIDPDDITNMSAEGMNFDVVFTEEMKKEAARRLSLEPDADAISSILDELMDDDD